MVIRNRFTKLVGQAVPVALHELLEEDRGQLAVRQSHVSGGRQLSQYHPKLCTRREK